MSGSVGRKRQKTRSLRALLSSSSPPVPEPNLDDSLLAEILRRLPGPRFLFQCTCVCKQWYSVISSPYFARLFINNHIALLNEDEEEKENNVLVSYKKNPSSVIASCATSPLFGNPDLKTCNVFLRSAHDDPLFQTLDLCFNYLPVKKEPVHVLAAFNDLVLCCAGRTRHFLVNPFTRKWVALPPVPVMGKGRVSCGLVGEPHCVKDSKGDYTFNSQIRYRVALIADALHARTPSVSIYYSEIGKWHTTVLENENALTVCIVHSNVIAYKGKLLWCFGKCIIEFNPFIISKTRYIELPSNCPTPSDNSHILVKCSIGVCRGFLRLVVWECSAAFHNAYVTVWELEDYRLGKWKEVHRRPLLAFVKCHRHWTLPGLGGHPSDPNVMYSIGDDFNIISCDLHTTDFGVAADMSPKLTEHPSVEAFPFVLPLWPTPIPVPPKHS
ncbi:hypothetical protein Tsubulata_018461 [Turnera subulata]|uniref:F-box domain-containing protein n=1 Tax=Turnera subulata TaxID=218843 RepID=A0A9Q0JCU6_9ROSI|nr:hypothetical protein Tsubulata_018461 [Turnera subulata]